MTRGSVNARPKVKAMFQANGSGAAPGRATAVAILALVVSAAGAGAAPPARAAEETGREKLAVFVLGTTEKDAELADNLTEVIIGAIAQRRGVEMAG
ncbi:MAG: hypothetical protein ABIW57_00140, partial [Polyangia bacterium]